MPNTILEGDHPRNISAKCDWDWPRSFRAEDYIYIYIIDIYVSSWSAIICGDQFTHRHFNIFIFTYQFQIYIQFIQFLIHQFQNKFNFKYMHCNIVENFCQILPNLFIELFCFRASRIIYMTLHVKTKNFGKSWKKTIFQVKNKLLLAPGESIAGLHSNFPCSKVKWTVHKNGT